MEYEVLAMSDDLKAIIKENFNISDLSLYDCDYSIYNTKSNFNNIEIEDIISKIFSKTFE